ncbi:hypothetical protein C8R44DRAFT_868868 [Mycena epipterygia]|nr:hypothetical protein C8R44DRAFT_868868 [Mycena epipterygia]
MGISLSTQYVPSWQDSCAATFNCTSEGLVNKLGEAIAAPAACLTNGSVSPDVWGITFKACQENCGIGILRQSVEFSSSAIAIATWLLPWIALIAQLPFEASGWMDLLSSFLSVGSPALAAYSLALTAFNRRYISHKFEQLRKHAQETRDQYHYMVQRVDAAALILQEAQQCPMRANQRNGELASLIVLNDDRIANFWKTAAKDLENTRRGFTYSFLAQALTLAFNLLPALSGAGCSQSSLGSQYKAGCIKAALTDNKIIPDHDAAGKVQYVSQKGLCANADVHVPLTPLDPPPPTTPVAAANDTGPGAGTPNRRHGTSRMEVPRLDGLGVPLSNNYASTSELELHTLSMTIDHDDDSTQPLLACSTPLAPFRPPTWWGFDVRGDERREGPIFTYARIFTSFACVEHVGRGFEESIKNFQAHAAIPEGAEEAAESCRFESRDLVAFTAWSKIPTPAIQHMIGAAIVALFLQWGTTGAAIYVAYNTPAVGLGCRSGSYLIYGIAATLSWAMLVFSHLVSHVFMQRFEQDPERPRTAVMNALAGLAVITRFTGKAIAISNALWLIVSSVLEDIETFQTCWCQTDAFQYGANGWTPVFKGTADLRVTAGGIWIGGFIFSIAVSILVGGFFAYLGDGTS